MPCGVREENKIFPRTGTARTAWNNIQAAIYLQKGWLSVLYAKNLPGNAGVEILGDPLDFDRLYDSLHEIVGEEGEHAGYDAVGINACRQRLAFDLASLG